MQISSLQSTQSIPNVTFTAQFGSHLQLMVIDQYAVLLFYGQQLPEIGVGGQDCWPGRNEDC
jgi:hypothetical protein